MRTHQVSVLLSLLLLGACASSSGRAGGGGNVITPEEIQTEGANAADGYMLVQRLRPSWLRSRVSSLSAGGAIYPMVFLNDRPYGELTNLRDFQPSELDSLEYLSGSDATTRYGTGYPAGAIIVRTRR